MHLPSLRETTSSITTFVIVAALAACAGDPSADSAAATDPTAPGGGSSGGTPPGVSDGGAPKTDAATKEPFVPSRRFASSAASWTLPPGALASTALTARATAWDLVDLDGDGRPELVVTSDANGKVLGGAASPHWNVYTNDGSALSTTPVPWPVPSDRFSYLRVACAAMIDIDGDRLPDLVDFCEVGSGDPKPWGSAAGTPHWNVHKNLGNGFAKTSTPYALPLQAPLVVASVATTVGTKQPFVSMDTWAAIDIDGDGKLELLAMQPKTSWSIYRATAAGFTTPPTSFGVPSGGSDPLNAYTFGRLSGNLWATMDVDGDQLLDFIVTGNTVGSARRPFTTAKSTPYWKVYRGSSTGFASTPTTWVVPGGVEYPEDGDPYGTRSATFDIDGDGKPDLVTFGARDVFGAAAGTPHWRVYLGSSDRFGQPKPGAAAVPADPGPSVDTLLLHEWKLPTATVAGLPLVSRDATKWATLDIDGDGRPDLVDLSDASRWNVYRGEP